MPRPEEYERRSAHGHGRAYEREPGQPYGAWRHEFRPGRLVLGLTGLGIAALYAGDATGAWVTPWYAVLPLLGAGLVLAGVTGRLGHRARRRRAARAASSDSSGAPASTSGSQAIR
ncbi:hypothetical protein [Streptomyces lavendofoliae]|uniref:Uncharacterized protein n=1 Tax=Streptomyces lavendofoliae TaxID=67314 RepID=A0A918HXP9_9ACTN|nr:hypothetical protein [Streptomyces lavendofoliae]GGU35458.1 hypothetical protein GCM10010274_23380 [Streptomyces lavendofoliae]